MILDVFYHHSLIGWLILILACFNNRKAHTQIERLNVDDLKYMLYGKAKELQVKGTLICVYPQQDTQSYN